MKIIKILSKIRTKANQLLFKYWRLKGKSIAEYFRGIDKIYLASADQYIGLSPIADSPDILQCKHFYSVIGGMGGLNILFTQERLETITFFDINPQAKFVCEIHIELIRHAADRNEFISMIYGRKFDALKYTQENQREYYKLDIDSAWHKQVAEILGPELFCVFQEIYLPYIQNPLVDTYQGVSLHVTRMPVFHEAPVDAVMTYPFYRRFELKLRRISCINSFFMGKGWLATEARFQHVKRLLNETPVAIRICPIHELEPPDESGLYATNVVERNYLGLRSSLNKFAWTIAYTPQSRYQYAGYIETEHRLIPVEKIYGEGLENPHKTCCMLLDAHFNLNEQVFLEVIHSPNYGLEYGFRFYQGQRAISVDDFLAIPEDQKDIPSIIGIHILLGCGLPVDIWRKVITQAHQFYQHNTRVNALFIFEHNRASLDWPELDVDTDNILQEDLIDKFLLEFNPDWKKYGLPSITGDATNLRNLCWILKKTA